MLLTMIILAIMLAHGCGKENCRKCIAYKNEVNVGERTVCNTVEEGAFEAEFDEADEIRCGE